jgi:1-acyl-sn-glycerol-3-phosphate acyltransferase
MWHRLFPRFCGRVYFRTLSVRGVEHAPPAGPVLWLGLHRNGAVDGFAYSAALRRPWVFLISTQLRKNFLARIFFSGIAVARTAEEGDRTANRAALAECVALMRGGGELFVFPEGTSTLGPRHLPFKAGAVQLILDWLESGGGVLNVIPLGVHYDCAWAFRSNVEVVVGPPIEIALANEMAPLGRLRELKRRTTIALETVGVNFSDAGAQREAEALATLASLTHGRSRFATLKAFEAGVPSELSIAWRALDSLATERRAARYHAVPLAPAFAGVRELAVLLVLGPVVIVGIAVNAPPWLAAWGASRKLADDSNVISLWKILVGLPAFVVWMTLVVGVLAAFQIWRGVGAFALLTWVMCAGYDRTKRAAVGAYNGLRHRALRPRFIAVIELLEKSVRR